MQKSSGVSKFLDIAFTLIISQEGTWGQLRRAVAIHNGRGFLPATLLTV